jgi:hypothetical membrane protein
MNKEILKNEIKKYGLFFYIISGLCLICIGGIGISREDIVWDFIFLYFLYLTIKSGIYFTIYMKRLIRKEYGVPLLPQMRLASITKRELTNREIFMYALFITTCYFVGGICWYLEKIRIK